MLSFDIKLKAANIFNANTFGIVCAFQPLRQVFFKKREPFTVFFTLFSSFQYCWQYISNITFADDWIRTADLHNHCPGKASYTSQSPRRRKRGGGKAQVLSIIFSSIVATTFLSALGKVEDEIFRYYLSEVESLMSNWSKYSIESRPHTCDLFLLLLDHTVS